MNSFCVFIVTLLLAPSIFAAELTVTVPDPVFLTSIVLPWLGVVGSVSVKVLEPCII